MLEITDACTHVLAFTAGKTFDGYVGDILLRSAVERQMEIIGEALGQALRIAPVLSEHITDSRDIVRFRNQLIHQYAYVMHNIVWDIIHHELPRLQQEALALLEIPEDSQSEQ